MITNILFYSTLVLNFAGVIFSCIYLWINLDNSFLYLADRNAKIIKITKTSMIISIIFGFLTCLLSDSVSIEAAIEKSALLFTIISISWLVVLVGCGIVMLFTVISKTTYRESTARAIKSLFTIALPGAIICLVLTWLFS